MSEKTNSEQKTIPAEFWKAIEPEFDQLKIKFGSSCFNNSMCVEVARVVYRKLTENKAPLLRLDIARFSKLSAQRAQTGFKTYKNVPITYWTTALAGEVGELCNMVKKMERVAHGGIDGGSSYTAASLSNEDLAEEVGGIFIYLNLLSGLLDIDMERAIINTFNSKSEKYGFPEKYPEKIPSPEADLPSNVVDGEAKPEEKLSGP